MRDASGRTDKEVREGQGEAGGSKREEIRKGQGERGGQREAQPEPGKDATPPKAPASNPQ
jgi:hypothetical protein